MTRLLIPAFTEEGLLYHIHCGNVALLGQGMGQYGNVLTMKKIENAVLHSPLLCSQFVDSITKNVRLWPPQFVTCFLESLYPHHALCERLFVRSTKGDQPIQNRCRSIEIPKKDDMCFRQSNPHNYSIFAILFKPADSPCFMLELGLQNVAQAIVAQEYTHVHLYASEEIREGRRFCGVPRTGVSAKGAATG